jgi:uncharacterized membrane protein YccC
VSAPAVSDSAPLGARLRADFSHARWKETDLPGGLRTGLFTLVPLLIGFALGSPISGVIATLGALNVFNVDLMGGPKGPARLLAFSVVANSLAFGAGTLVGLVPEPGIVPLIALGTFLPLLAGLRAHGGQVGLIAAVVFVIAVGLGGATAAEAPARALLIGAGGAWALFGAMIPRWWPRLRAVSPPRPPLLPHEYPGKGLGRVAFPAVVAATTAIGFFVGARLEVVRDFWVMLTILLALQPQLAATFEFGVLRIAGTIAGAAIAYTITVSLTDGWVLGEILALAAILMYATRTVNYIVYATALTVFVIVLLNFVVAGGSTLALVRVVDTALGGGLALVAGALLWVAYRPSPRPR